MPRILCALIKGKSAGKGRQRERERDPNANEIFSIIFKLTEMNYLGNA